MKIEEHPLFRSDKQMMIIYLDSLVSIYENYNHLMSGYGVRLCRNPLDKINVSEGLELLANTIGIDITVTPLDDIVFEYKKSFIYKNVEFFQYYFREIENETI